MRKIYLRTFAIATFLVAFLGTNVMAQELNWADTLDRADWVITSVTIEDNPAIQAIDGDPMTFWSTPWREGETMPLPHYITIDLGDVYEVSELIYVPRQDQWGPNGTIRDYTIKMGYNEGDMDNTTGWYKPKYDEQNTVSGSLVWPDIEYDDSGAPTNRDDFKDTVALTMTHPLVGRYLRVQCDSGVSNVPEAIYAEIYAVGKKAINREGMVSREHWKVVEADTSLNPLHWAIDENLGQWWSTPWNPPDSLPHEIVIDMAEEVDIDSLLYISRQDVWGPNGTVNGFELYVSNDMDAWGDPVLVDTIDWYGLFDPMTPYDSLVLHKNFAPIVLESTATGRYVKLNILDNITHNNHEVLMNELYVYGEVTGANYTNVTGDYLINPDFELGLEGWSLNAWGGMVLKATDDAVQGDSAAYIELGGGSVNHAPLDLKVDTRYQVSFMSKQPKGGFVDVGTRNKDDGRYLGNVHGKESVDWDMFSFNIATNADFADGISFYFWNGGGNDSIFLDDFKLMEIGPANFVAPVAMAGDDVDLKAGESKMLDGTKSYDENSGTVLKYNWTAGEGLAIDDATLAKPTITADMTPDDVAIEVILTVSDPQGHSDMDTLTVNVTGVVVPVASAGDDQTVAIGATVTLDGSGSTGTDLTYAWTAPAGITLDDATAVSPTFVAPDVTEDTPYEFSLVVASGDMVSEADMVTVTVMGPDAIQNINAVNYRVYPNPSNGLFTVETELAVEIEVRDVLGRKLVSENFTEGKNELDLSSFGQGLYFLQLKEGVNISTVMIRVK